jgi:hypothetical protein
MQFLKRAHKNKNCRKGMDYNVGSHEQDLVLAKGSVAF